MTGFLFLWTSIHHLSAFNPLTPSFTEKCFPGNYRQIIFAASC